MTDFQKLLIVSSRRHTHTQTLSHADTLTRRHADTLTSFPIALQTENMVGPEGLEILLPNITSLGYAVKENFSIIGDMVVY